MMTIEAMKQALERMKGVRIFVNSKEKIKQPEGAEWFEEGIKALEEAIAEAEKQEPVAKPTEDMVLALRGNSGLCTQDAYDALVDVLAVMPLYTHPQPRTWVGLTDEERSALWWSLDWSGMPEHEYGKAIEAKLRSKNT